MPTVWILVPVFKVGGVEKWVEYVCRSLSSNFEVRVYVTGDVDPRALEIYPSVAVRRVSIFSLIIEALRCPPDVVISALTRSNVLSCAIFGLLKTKLIASLHLTLGRVSSHSPIHYFFRVLAHIWIDFWVDHVIAVSHGVKEDFVELTHSSGDHVSVIYNPCFDELDISLNFNYREVEGPVRFVSVGRFDSQKNFDDLVVSFVEVLRQGFDYYLDIYGDGPLFSSVQNLVPNQFAGRIKFLGNQPGILSRLSNYDVFVLPSRYEGFGNVLAEALGSGLFCLSRDCPHGPSEILNRGEFGELVSIEADLASSLRGVKFLLQDYLRNFDSDKKERLRLHLCKFSSEEFSRRLRLLVIEVSQT